MLVTLNSALIMGVPTLTLVGSSTPARRVARILFPGKKNAFSLSLSPGTLMTMAPVTAIFIVTACTSISPRGMARLAIVTTSAYDMLAPSLSVKVTADVHGARGSVTVDDVVPFLVVVLAAPPTGSGIWTDRRL